VPQVRFDDKRNVGKTGKEFVEIIESPETDSQVSGLWETG